MTNDFIFGIKLTTDHEKEDYKEFLKEEYKLSDKEIGELKMAYLFRLADNIRFGIYDADLILLDTENEQYYPTGEFFPTNYVGNNKIVALVDNNCALLAV